MNRNIYFKIKQGNSIFQILQTEDFGKRSYILLNADGKECVYVNVKRKGTEMHMSMVKYNKTCTIGIFMERGTQTVQMIKTFLRFLLTKETFSKVSFIDTSTFECKLETSSTTTNEMNMLMMNEMMNEINTNLIDYNDEEYTIPIALAFHNITIYGKTWYERHLGATVSDSSISEQIAVSVQNLHKLITKESLFKRLNKTIEQHLESTESETFRSVLQYILDKMTTSIGSNSWMHFFHDSMGSNGSVSTIFGNQYACSLYYMMDGAINELFKIPYECESLPMELSIETIESYPIIEDLGENSNPIYKKSWQGGRTRRMKRLPKHIPISHYYNRRSLKRKAL